jgi:hypothetical protein
LAAFEVQSFRHENSMGNHALAATDESQMTLPDVAADAKSGQNKECEIL